MKKNKNKSLKKIFVEIILLGALTGLFVNLTTGAIDDMFGVCGFLEGSFGLVIVPTISNSIFIQKRPDGRFFLPKISAGGR